MRSVPARNNWDEAREEQVQPDEEPMVEALPEEAGTG